MGKEFENIIQRESSSQMTDPKSSIVFHQREATPTSSNVTNDRLDISHQRGGFNGYRNVGGIDFVKAEFVNQQQYSYGNMSSEYYLSTANMSPDSQYTNAILARNTASKNLILTGDARKGGMDKNRKGMTQSTLISTTTSMRTTNEYKAGTDIGMASRYKGIRHQRTKGGYANSNNIRAGLNNTGMASPYNANLIMTSITPQYSIASQFHSEGIHGVSNTVTATSDEFYPVTSSTYAGSNSYDEEVVYPTTGFNPSETGFLRETKFNFAAPLVEMTYSTNGTMLNPLLTPPKGWSANRLDGGIYTMSDSKSEFPDKDHHAIKKEIGIPDQETGVPVMSNKIDVVPLTDNFDEHDMKSYMSSKSTATQSKIAQSKIASSGVYHNQSSPIYSSKIGQKSPLSVLSDSPSSLIVTPANNWQDYLPGKDGGDNNSQGRDNNSQGRDNNSQGRDNCGSPMHVQNRIRNPDWKIRQYFEKRSRHLTEHYSFVVEVQTMLNTDWYLSFAKDSIFHGLKDIYLRAKAIIDQGYYSVQKKALLDESNSNSNSTETILGNTKTMIVARLKALLTDPMVLQHKGPDHHRINSAQMLITDLIRDVENAADNNSTHLKAVSPVTREVLEKESEFYYLQNGEWFLDKEKLETRVIRTQRHGYQARVYGGAANGFVSITKYGITGCFSGEVGDQKRREQQETELAKKQTRMDRRNRRRQIIIARGINNTDYDVTETDSDETDFDSDTDSDLNPPLNSNSNMDSFTKGMDFFDKSLGVASPNFSNNHSTHADSPGQLHTPLSRAIINESKEDVNKKSVNHTSVFLSTEKPSIDKTAIDKTMIDKTAIDKTSKTGINIVDDDTIIGDIDVSMEEVDFETSEIQNFRNKDEKYVVVCNLKHEMDQYPNWYTNLHCIPGRFPLIRGQMKFSGSRICAVDLTIANNHAVANTALLRAYATCNYAQMLGVMVKNFAKKYKICSELEGTLSSYCWSIMVIYYLQCQGLLPVLQLNQEDIIRSNAKTKTRNINTERIERRYNYSSEWGKGYFNQQEFMEVVNNEETPYPSNTLTPVESLEPGIGTWLSLEDYIGWRRQEQRELNKFSIEERTKEEQANHKRVWNKIQNYKEILLKGDVLEKDFLKNFDKYNHPNCYQKTIKLPKKLDKVIIDAETTVEYEKNWFYRGPGFKGIPQSPEAILDPSLTIEKVRELLIKEGILDREAINIPNSEVEKLRKIEAVNRYMGCCVTPYQMHTDNLSMTRLYLGFLQFYGASFPDPIKELNGFSPTNNGLKENAKEKSIRQTEGWNFIKKREDFERTVLKKNRILTVKKRSELLEKIGNAIKKRLEEEKLSSLFSKSKLESFVSSNPFFPQNVLVWPHYLQKWNSYVQSPSSESRICSPASSGSTSSLGFSPFCTIENSTSSGGFPIPPRSHWDSLEMYIGPSSKSILLYDEYCAQFYNLFHRVPYHSLQFEWDIELQQRVQQVVNEVNQYNKELIRRITDPTISSLRQDISTIALKRYRERYPHLPWRTSPLDEVLKKDPENVITHELRQAMCYPKNSVIYQTYGCGIENGGIIVSNRGKPVKNMNDHTSMTKKKSDDAVLSLLSIFPRMMHSSYLACGGPFNWKDHVIKIDSTEQWSKQYWVKHVTEKFDQKNAEQQSQRVPNFVDAKNPMIMIQDPLLEGDIKQPWIEGQKKIVEALRTEFLLRSTQLKAAEKRARNLGSEKIICGGKYVGKYLKKDGHSKNSPLESMFESPSQEEESKKKNLAEEKIRKKFAKFDFYGNGSPELRAIDREELESPEQEQEFKEGMMNQNGMIQAQHGMDQHFIDMSQMEARSLIAKAYENQHRLNTMMQNGMSQNQAMARVHEMMLQDTNGSQEQIRAVNQIQSCIQNGYDSAMIQAMMVGQQQQFVHQDGIAYSYPQHTEMQQQQQQIGMQQQQMGIQQSQQIGMQQQQMGIQQSQQIGMQQQQVGMQEHSYDQNPVFQQSGMQKPGMQYPNIMQQQNREMQNPSIREQKPGQMPQTYQHDEMSHQSEQTAAIQKMIGNGQREELFGKGRSEQNFAKRQRGQAVRKGHREEMLTQTLSAAYLDGQMRGKGELYPSPLQRKGPKFMKGKEKRMLEQDIFAKDRGLLDEQQIQEMQQAQEMHDTQKGQYIRKGDSIVNPTETGALRQHSREHLHTALWQLEGEYRYGHTNQFIRERFSEPTKVAHANGNNIPTEPTGVLNPSVSPIEKTVKGKRVEKILYFHAMKGDQLSQQCNQNVQASQQMQPAFQQHGILHARAPPGLSRLEGQLGEPGQPAEGATRFKLVEMKARQQADSGMKSLSESASHQESVANAGQNSLTNAAGNSVTNADGRSVTYAAGGNPMLAQGARGFDSSQTYGMMQPGVQSGVHPMAQIAMNPDVDQMMQPGVAQNAGNRITPGVHQMMQQGMKGTLAQGLNNINGMVPSSMSSNNTVTPGTIAVVHNAKAGGVALSRQGTVESKSGVVDLTVVHNRGELKNVNPAFASVLPPVAEDPPVALKSKTLVVPGLGGVNPAFAQVPPVVAHCAAEAKAPCLEGNANPALFDRTGQIYQQPEENANPAFPHVDSERLIPARGIINPAFAPQLLEEQTLGKSRRPQQALSDEKALNAPLSEQNLLLSQKTVEEQKVLPRQENVDKQNETGVDQNPKCKSKTQARAERPKKRRLAKRKAAEIVAAKSRERRRKKNDWNYWNNWNNWKDKTAPGDHQTGCKNGATSSNAMSGNATSSNAISGNSVSVIPTAMTNATSNHAATMPNTLEEGAAAGEGHLQGECVVAGEGHLQDGHSVPAESAGRLRYAEDAYDSNEDFVATERRIKFGHHQPPLSKKQRKEELKKLDRRKEIRVIRIRERLENQHLERERQTPMDGFQQTPLPGATPTRLQQANIPNRLHPPGLSAPTKNGGETLPTQNAQTLNPPAPTQTMLDAQAKIDHLEKQLQIAQMQAELERMKAQMASMNPQNAGSMNPPNAGSMDPAFDLGNPVVNPNVGNPVGNPAFNSANPAMVSSAFTSAVNPALDKRKGVVSGLRSGPEKGILPQNEGKGFVSGPRRAPQGERKGSVSGPRRAPQGQRKGSVSGPRRAPQGERKGSVSGPRGAPQGERKGSVSGPRRAPQGERKDSVSGPRRAPQGERKGFFQASKGESKGFCPGPRNHCGNAGSGVSTVNSLLVGSSMGAAPGF